MGAAKGFCGCSHSDRAQRARDPNDNSTIVLVAHLGTDQIFQLCSTTSDADAIDAGAALKAGSGPSHSSLAATARYLRTSSATVSTLPWIARVWRSEIASLAYGTIWCRVRRAYAGPHTQRLWASDLHSSERRFLYDAERTSSAIGAFRVYSADCKLGYLRSTLREAAARVRSLRQALHGGSARNRRAFPPTRSTRRTAR